MCISKQGAVRSAYLKLRNLLSETDMHWIPMPAAFMSELWEDVHGQMHLLDVCTIYTLIQVQENIKKIKTRVKGQEEKIYQNLSLYLSVPFFPLPFTCYSCLLSDSCSTQYSTNILSINSRLDSFIGSREIASDQNRALADKDLTFKGVICLNNWRRQWHPTPVPLPGKSHGQRSLVGCSPWGH